MAVSILEDPARADKLMLSSIIKALSVWDGRRRMAIRSAGRMNDNMVVQCGKVLMSAFAVLSRLNYSVKCTESDALAYSLISTLLPLVCDPLRAVDVGSKKQARKKTKRKKTKRGGKSGAAQGSVHRAATDALNQLEGVAVDPNGDITMPPELFKVIAARCDNQPTRIALMKSVPTSDVDACIDVLKVVAPTLSGSSNVDVVDGAVNLAKRAAESGREALIPLLDMPSFLASKITSVVAGIVTSSSFPDDPINALVCTGAEPNCPTARCVCALGVAASIVANDTSSVTKSFSPVALFPILALDEPKCRELAVQLLQLISEHRAGSAACRGLASALTKHADAFRDDPGALSSRISSGVIPPKNVRSIAKFVASNSVSGETRLAMLMLLSTCPEGAKLSLELSKLLETMLKQTTFSDCDANTIGVLLRIVCGGKHKTKRANYITAALDCEDARVRRSTLSTFTAATSERISPSAVADIFGRLVDFLYDHTLAQSGAFV